MNQLKAADSEQAFKAIGDDLPEVKSFGAYLAGKIESGKKSKAQVFRDAGIDRIYGYQILRENIHPSRNRVLALGIASGCDLETIRRMLKLADHGDLYPKRERDAVLIFAISRGMDIDEVDEFLEKMGQDPLREDT